MQIARLELASKISRNSEGASQEARILVLDEPTAALTDVGVETLFGILNKLRARGVGMIYSPTSFMRFFRSVIGSRSCALAHTVGTEATKGA